MTSVHVQGDIHLRTILIYLNDSSLDDGILQSPKQKLDSLPVAPLHQTLIMSTVHDGRQKPAETQAIVPSCVPSTTFSQKLYQHAASHLEPVILNHSLRVYIYASALSQVDLTSIPQLQPTAGPEIFSPSTNHADLDKSLLFAASMFHDMGTSVAHDHDQRFEVCGADAAVAFMHSHGMSDPSDQRKVWEAIALHTSPGIAERMGPLTRLIRMAVKADFGNELYRGLLDDEVLENAETMLKRGEIEKVLGDCVAGQAEMRESEGRAAKAPAVSWAWNLLRCKLEEPEWEGVNKGF